MRRFPDTRFASNFIERFDSIIVSVPLLLEPDTDLVGGRRDRISELGARRREDGHELSRMDTPLENEASSIATSADLEMIPKTHGVMRNPRSQSEHEHRAHGARFPRHQADEPRDGGVHQLAPGALGYRAVANDDAPDVFERNEARLSIARKLGDPRLGEADRTIFQRFHRHRGDSSSRPHTG